MKSEWGMRGALVHLHPSRPDGSPPSVVRRHHKHENADKHTETNMLPHILSPVCTHQTVYEHSLMSRFPQESLHQRVLPRECSALLN